MIILTRILDIVPFVRRQLPSVVHLGEGKDEMSAQERVDVGGQELPLLLSVLRPVGVVADSPIAGF